MNAKEYLDQLEKYTKDLYMDVNKQALVGILSALIELNETMKRRKD